VVLAARACTREVVQYLDTCSTSGHKETPQGSSAEPTEGYDRVSFGTQVERKGRRKTQTRAWR
jgi:hypothetical protein